MTEATETRAPRIVCAACLSTAGLIVIGIRHMDSLMRMQAFASGWDLSRDPAHQGFVDQYGAFYTRTAAWKVAEAAGQILRRCGGDTASGGTLYSENLY